MRRELVELWIRLVLLLPQNIWHSIDDTEEFSPTIRSAISLSTLEYQRLLQHALPQVLDNDTRDDLITNIEKLKEFLEGFDDFLYNLDKKNKERFKTKKGDF